MEGGEGRGGVASLSCCESDIGLMLTYESCPFSDMHSIIIGAAPFYVALDVFLFNIILQAIPSL